jgi:hypothetical protein
MKLIIESENPFLVQNPGEFIVEANRNKPGWVAEASKKDFATAAVCPSFVMLFRNSYLIKCPAQVDISYAPENNKTLINTNPEQMELEGHDLIGQMGKEFSDYISMKVGIKAYLHTTEPCLPLFLSAFPYAPENDRKLRAMEGVYPLNDKLKQVLNINMMIHKQDLRTTLERSKGLYRIHAGTPLALLYFPGGLPELEMRHFDPTVPTMNQSRHKKGSYLARMKEWFRN